MPANTSVVRRGRDVRDGSDEASDSDSDDGEPSSSRAPDADQDSARKRKRKGNEPSGEYPDDLDCLASDDDDDETRRGLVLGRSVGRCAALDREDEYDYYDAVAAGEKKEKAAAGSGGAGPLRAARATYVPPAKRTRGGARTTTARRVAWDGDVREARREPRGNAVRAPARTSDVPSRRRGNSWVPDHVRNPHKYDCYALDEPLIIGGGSHPGDVGSIATPDLGDPKTVTRGSANAVRENEGSRNAAFFRGVGPPGGGDGAEGGETRDDDAKRVQMPTPTFSASSTAATAAREAARRRRDERRVVVAANGAVPAVPAKAERNENLVSFDDAADDDEAEDGGGGGAAGARVAGFKRGNVKRARSLRKRGV
jgi:hypothetical protein